MIDWMNPSADVVEAKQIGYQEGWHAGEDAAREVEARSIAVHCATIAEQAQRIEGNAVVFTAQQERIHKLEARNAELRELLQRWVDAAPSSTPFKPLIARTLRLVPTMPRQKEKGHD